MAAPSGIVWGDIKGSYGRIGIYVSISNTQDLKSHVTIETWFWSKYSVSDSNNTYKFDNDSTSATTNLGDVDITTSVSSGSGWSDENQICIGTHTFEYDRTTVAKTVYCAAKLSGVDKVSSGGTMSISTSYTIPAIPVYTITYDANGGSGAPASQTKVHGTTLVLPTTIPVKNGSIFLGWDSSATAETATYEAGGDFTANRTVTLYAVWSANTFTVTYDANGGSGAPGEQTKIYGEDLVLSSQVPTKEMYTFLGWGISPTATNVLYIAGGTYDANASITLYAIWENAYSRPRISVTNLHRAIKTVTDEDEIVYKQSDTGTYFTASVYYEVDAEPLQLKVEWRPSIGSSWDKAITYVVDIPSSAYGYRTTFPLTLGDEDETNTNYISSESTYLIRFTVYDEVSESSLEFTLPGAQYSLDFLAGGKGAAFGKPAETESLLEVAWNTRVNAIMSAESISADESILANKAEFDTVDVTTTVNSTSATITYLFDRYGTRNTNGLTIYGGSTDPIDPDTTIEHLILTDINTPTGTFMYIKTEFYQTKTKTSNRVQTALPYNSDGNPYTRRYYSGAWTEWIPLHAGLADVYSTSGTVSTTTSVSLVADKWTVTEDGVYGMSGYVYWAANSSGYRVLLLRNTDTSGTQIGAAIAQERRYNVGSGQIGQSISGFRRLTKGSEVRLIVLQNSGSTLTIDPYVLDIVKISP